MPRYDDVEYLLDGEPAIEGRAGLEEFIDANDFDADTVAALRALRPGETFTIPANENGGETIIAAV